MTRHEFVLKLNREVTAEEVEALYKAGSGDAGVESGALGTVLDFSRKAPTLAEALVSAVRDIEKVPGLRAVGVACESIVSLSDIADRAGVTREAARLWATGQRGPGGFPSPVLITTGGEQGWDWQQVGLWLRHHKASQGGATWSVWATANVRVRTLCTADRVLAAREALWSEPDVAVREEFERLLEDA
jgi:hypothetical protein